MPDVINEGDMAQLGTANVEKGRRDSLQQEARGFLRVPEPAQWALLWMLVAAGVIGPWGLLGLLLWWLSGALMGI